MYDQTLIAKIWGMADLVTPMTIRVAATLRLADHISAGVVSVPDLAERTGTDLAALRRVVAHLVAVGVFAEPKPDTLALTTLSEQLIDDGPGGTRSLLDIDTHMGSFHIDVSRLLEIVRTGKPTRGMWEELDADAGLSDSFDDQMAGMTSVVAEDLARTYDWSTVKHLVDVGGGSGIMTATLLTAHPHLTATLIDREGPVGNAARRFAEAGLADRASVAVESFLEPIEARGDVYLISEVLVDWNDENAQKILASVAAAAQPGDRVLVMEPVYDRSDHTSTQLDLIVLPGGGRNRSTEDRRAMGAACGLTLTEVMSVRPPDSLTVFVKD